MPYSFHNDAINKDNLVPLYYQLFLDIDKQIKDGILLTNEALPTEKEFCDFYKISRATVRQATNLLKTNKAIYKSQGVGSFVAEKKIEQTLDKFYSFSDEIKKQGKNYSSKFIKLEKLDDDDNIKSHLNLNYKEFYYRLQRVRSVNDQVILYEETFLSATRFNDIDLDKIISHGLYNYLRLTHEFKPKKAIEHLSAIKLDKTIASMLQAKSGDPSLCIERHTYEDDTIIEYTIAYAKNDMIKFSKTWDLMDNLTTL